MVGGHPGLLLQGTTQLGVHLNIQDIMDVGICYTENYTCACTSV